MDATMTLNILRPCRTIIVAIFLFGLYLPCPAPAATIAEVNDFVKTKKVENPNCRIEIEEYYQDFCMKPALGIRVYKDCSDSTLYKQKRYIISNGQAGKCITYCGWMEIERCSGLDSVATQGFVNVGEVYYGVWKYEYENTYCSGRTDTFLGTGPGGVMNQKRCLVYSGPVNNCPGKELLPTFFFPVCKGDDPCCETCDPCCGKPKCCDTQAGNGGQ